MSNLVVTELGNTLVAAGYQEGSPLWFECRRIDEVSILGNIYVGKVMNIVKNIQAAFVQIADGIICYYSLKENPNPVYIKKIGKSELVQGDEILVQVEKEALKTKDPVASSNLNIPGKYMALTTGNQKIGISSKISHEKKQKLKSFFSTLDLKGNGIVVRTNAATASEEVLQKEFDFLMQRLQKIKENAIHRTAFSLLYKADSFYLQQLRNSYTGELDKIITDVKSVYTEMEEYLSVYQPEDKGRLTFYEDKNLSLASLYNITRDLERALQPQVWMKSGAYLVIEPTEACTVIDVNTGKCDSKRKDRQKTFLKINLEAAKEVANQIKLRNLSGIILVDFIDLEQEEDRATLMHELHELLKKDAIPTNLVDMTKLQLVEITRKKQKKPLHEQITLRDVR
ncbi:MAG: ribonuclease E/G [Lachnospiraceae bacterium]|nr:ribonuclease E/G [Lachnospiraceae bacterium]